MKATLARPTLSVLAVAALALASVARSRGFDSQAGKATAPEEALQRAISNEAKLKTVELDYSYRQDILVQTFGEARSLTAQLHRVSEFTYDDLGDRVERILDYPPSPLTTALDLPKPDFKSLIGIEPFFLTPETQTRYTVRFLERQKLDELATYAFAVEPVELRGASKWPRGEHPFKGRIWIDDQDFQIVKAEGIAVLAKDERARFPKFEFYREIVDDKYWLPSFLYADDVLNFRRFDLPIKVKITYSAYKRVRPGR
ncbi:MAG TPA: hypothetical protein VJH03_08410 [Blastocatellia bacterium]|nr:hypothetical protein [Blastocatellia bacterium]